MTLSFLKNHTRKLAIGAVASAGLALAAFSAAPAQAEVGVGVRFGGGGFHHCCGGPRIGIGFGFGPYWGYPYYPYYAGYPYPYYPYYSYPYYSGYAPAADLTDHSRDAYYTAYRQALDAPLGQTIAWNDGAASGNITTTRDGWAGEKYCREFRQDTMVDGKQQQAIGTACRQPNGAWQPVQNQR